MLFQSMNRLGMPAVSAVAQDPDAAIKRIGRLVLICAAVVLVSAILLVGTALQATVSIDQADLAAERLRASNAIEMITAESGPLTPAQAERLGRLAGLRDAHLAYAVSLDSTQQQLPLLAGTGPSGSFLTWTRASQAEQMLRQFAPIRLPIIAGMLFLVLSLLMRLRMLVADIERQRRLALRQSRSDVVTGLANRLAFETTLSELAAGIEPFAVVVFDLDHFKAINDRFGHAAGDEVLRGVGTRLSRLLGPRDLLARVGGDEFVLLAPGVVDRHAMTLLARDCIAAVEQPTPVAGGQAKVGVSLGIVFSSEPHAAPARLVSLADEALYCAKSQTGSAFHFADDGRRTPVRPQDILASWRQMRAHA